MWKGAREIWLNSSLEWSAVELVASGGSIDRCIGLGQGKSMQCWRKKDRYAHSYIIR
jgi:hypothetical protein